MTRFVISTALAISFAQSAQTVQPPAGFPAAGAPPTVVVTSPGAEPRKRLRFVVAQGHRDHLTVDTTMTMTMAVGESAVPEVKMPRLRMDADAEVTAVSGTADMTISMTFTDVRWIATPDSDPSMTTLLNNTTASIKGLSGTTVVSDRGVTREAKFDTSKISDPGLAQALAPIQQMMQNMSFPLPEEPVGVGATWDVRLGLNANGVQTFTRYSAQLIAMDDTSFTLKVALDQTAPPQSISSPSTPGATVSVDAFTGTGSGTTKIRFDTLVPTSEMDLKTKMTMSIDMGGNTQQMNITMSLKSTVIPGVVK